MNFFNVSRRSAQELADILYEHKFNLVPRVRVTLDQRSGTRDSGIKRLPENKNPVIGQTAQASGIRTSGFTKWSQYSTRQLSFPWKNWG